MIEIHKFSVDDVCSITGTNELVQAARINQIAGPAYTAFKDGKPVACGGIRTVGVGEAWALYSPEILLETKKRQQAFITSEQRRNDVDEIATKSLLWLNNMIRNESIWRLWSECPTPIPNQKFLKHMGFTKVEAFLRG
jgi:hypothetical protein